MVFSALIFPDISGQDIQRYRTLFSSNTLIFKGPDSYRSTLSAVMQLVTAKQGPTCTDILQQI